MSYLFQHVGNIAVKLIKLLFTIRIAASLLAHFYMSTI